MRPLFTALRFLTVLPLPGADQAPDLPGSVAWFPVAGLLLGLTGAALVLALAPLLPAPVLALCACLALAALSGGLHLDGLADSADGLFSARSRERALEIMRDSRIGAMGVLALFFVLGLRAASLACLSPERMARAVLLMPLSGRVMLVLLMAALPYARAGSGGGLGGLFYGPTARRAVPWAVLLFAVPALALGPGLALLCGQAVLFLCLARLCRARLGGATGDTLGAGSELAETLTALLFTLHLP